MLVSYYIGTTGNMYTIDLSLSNGTVQAANCSCPQGVALHVHAAAAATTTTTALALHKAPA